MLNAAARVGCSRPKDALPALYPKAPLQLVHFCQPDIAQHDHATSRAVEIEADTVQVSQIKMRIRGREVL